MLTDWNRDFMPGPYPRTPEERAAAAKKYGLRVEDYEPYDDDGTGFGDYPKLPRISAEARDPYENYDIPELRRNFNEPVKPFVSLYLYFMISEVEKLMSFMSSVGPQGSTAFISVAISHMPAYTVKLTAVALLRHIPISELT